MSNSENVPKLAIVSDGYHVEQRGSEKIFVLDSSKWNKLNLLPSDDKLYLKENCSINIPKDICDKVGWEIGSKLWIQVEDEKLGQVIMGKVFLGEEAKATMKHLQALVDDKD